MTEISPRRSAGKPASTFASSTSAALPATALLVTVLLAGACASPPPPPAEPEREPVRVENASLGLAFADLTEGFSLASNVDGELKLAHADGGELWLEIGDEGRAGVNLVKEVNGWKTRYEAMPSGEFLGQVELGSQFGTTYTVRGRYDKDGQLTEERRMLCVFPAANRLLSAAYAYPVTETLNSKDRTDQMFAQFGELEIYYPDAPAAAEGG